MYNLLEWGFTESLRYGVELTQFTGILKNRRERGVAADAYGIHNILAPKLCVKWRVGIDVHPT